MVAELGREDPEFIVVEAEMQASVRSHRDFGHAGGIFSHYNVIRVCMGIVILLKYLWLVKI